MNTTNATHWAFVIGGEGPDAWERECLYNAVDFLDAAKQATAEAEREGGTVVALEQIEYYDP